VTLSNATEAAHTYTARATDAASNVSDASAGRTVTVDTTAPDTSVQQGPKDPTNLTTASFTFSSSEPNSTFECRLDGPGSATGTFGACPASYGPLADGAYTFRVRATDKAQNTDGTPATYPFTVDTQKPAAPVIVSPAAGANPLASHDVTLSGTAEPGATVKVFKDGEAQGSTTATGGDWSLTVHGVADGGYTFSATATDAAGNVSADSPARTVTVDTTPPPADVTGGPSGATTDSAPAFSFGSDPGTTFECRLDGPGGPGAYAPCTPPKAYAGLAPGDYTFFVRAIDAAGNASAPASRSFTVTAPVQAAQTPTPTFQQSVVVQPAGGKVLVRRKGTKTFVALDAAEGIPLGSEVNTKQGKVRLSSVPRSGGPVQTALFYAGIFVVTQTRGITNLKLSEPLAACPRRAAAAARKKPKTRRLWGDGSGAFRTQGRYSAATVRGTKWLVQDSCAGTLTKVARGVVSVNDRVRHKTILLKQGKRYLAKPRR
jgi:hypothetical protein